MTLKEAMEAIVFQLGRIPVPVDEYDIIGAPLSREIKNLQECIIAIERGEQDGNGNDHERTGECENNNFE